MSKTRLLGIAKAMAPAPRAVAILILAGLLLSQVVSAPPAEAIPVHDAVLYAKAVASHKEQLKRMSILYDNIRYIDPRKGNYIRGLIRDNLDANLSCRGGDAKWSKATNKINKYLDVAYKNAVVGPVYQMDCIPDDMPKVFKDQVEQIEQQDMANVNALEALTAIKTNIASAEVQRTWLGNQVGNVSKTGRSQTALLQKISVATTDTASILVEMQRGQAAILEVLIIQNKLSRDQRMIEINNEYIRRRDLGATMTTSNWW